MDPAIAESEVICTDMVVYEEKALALPSLALKGSNSEQRLDVPSDAKEVDIPTPLLAIGSSVDHDGLPPPSAFTQANDRLYRGPLLGERVTYRECQRIKGRNDGGHGLDGCKKYVPGGHEVSSTLRCKTCGCHRSYHRVEIYKNVTPIRSYDPSTGVTVYHSQPSM